MHILTVGLSHRTAPVELRERLAFAPDRLSLALKHLSDMKSILEAVIISTCNRMELYVIVDQLHTGEYYSKAFLENWFQIERKEFEPYLYIKKELEAINHLFHVVSGLDSLVIGETQILGQVKDAYQTALSAGTTGTIFNELMTRAIRFGKRVHHETEIGQNAVSVSYAAVELGKKLFASFAGLTVALVGAGKMSELTAKHFQANGAERVLVLNRTFARAKELAAKIDGEALELSKLPSVISEADIVVSSTGADQYVMTKEMIQQAVEHRVTPLFLIDIAVPRDIEPSVHDLDQVFLYNIDDLQEIVQANLTLRKQEATRVAEWIESEQKEFIDWLQMLGVIPIIRAIREKATSIQEETMERIERKLPDLTEKELRVIRKMTKSIINQMLRDPITRMKELANHPNREEIYKLIEYIFAIEEENSCTVEEEKDSYVPLVFAEKLTMS